MTNKKNVDLLILQLQEMHNVINEIQKIENKDFIIKNSILSLKKDYDLNEEDFNIIYNVLKNKIKDKKNIKNKKETLYNKLKVYSELTKVGIFNRKNEPIPLKELKSRISNKKSNLKKRKKQL